MAETVSQETISIPDATPVTDSVTPEQPQPITPDVIREKIRNNEFKSSEDFNEHLMKLDQANVTSEPQTTIPESPKPASEPPQEVAQPEPNNDIPVVSDEFLAEIHKAGFTYRNKNEVIKGLQQKEKAINTFKEDAIKNKAEAKKAREELDAAIKRQAELESLLKERQSQQTISQAPPITQGVSAELPLPPELPKYSLDEDEYNRSMDIYNKNVQDYYRKLDAYNEQKLNQTISNVKTEIVQKISDKDSIIAKIQQDNEAKRLREEYVQKIEHENKVRERAFEAANAFYKKDENKAYRLSKPIENQYKEYIELQNALSYMATKDPSLHQIAGQDPSGNLIREYISGNPYVVQAFASHDINITDDIKNYQLLVDLEADAYSHNDIDDQGRPDLEMALLRQKKIGGILLQERQDAKIDGFNEAQRVMQMNSSGATQLPTNAPSPSITQTPEMSQEQIIDKLRLIKTLPPDQFQTEREKLMPYLAKLNIVQKE